MTTWKNVKKVQAWKVQAAREEDLYGENINLLQEKLIEDPRISARKNDLNISNNTFNRITQRDLKWHPCMLHVIKEIIYKVDLLKENLDLFKRVMAYLRTWNTQYVIKECINLMLTFQKE